MAYSLIPGSHRLALHAIYAEAGRSEDRPQRHPARALRELGGWAKEKGHGLDFNPTYFAHPMAASGFTLSCYDSGVRDFWVEHGIICRKIGAYFGRELGTTCVTNHWIPDGMKDTPADRKTPRLLLKDSLDRIFAEPVDRRYNLRFGRGQAVRPRRGELHGRLARVLPRLRGRQQDWCCCLDSGHYHPTETISDKLSAVLPFVDEVMLHVSRGVRWDSDHVVILNDDLQAIMQEIVRGDYLAPRPHRAGLLRCEHQPRRRVDRGHAQRAEGAAAGAAGTVCATSASMERRGGLHGRGWCCWKN